MNMRDLTGPAQSRGIRDLIQSALVAETLVPSNPFWLLSGWISDIPVIDNRARQFAAIDTEWPASIVRLIPVLRTMLDRGGSIAVVLRDVNHNKAFIEKLYPLAKAHPNQVKLATPPDFHEKGIVGQDYEISGSMNFTHRGIEVSDEHVIYRTGKPEVEGRRLTLMGTWQNKLHALD
jgi:hypothetical protein